MDRKTAREIGEYLQRVINNTLGDEDFSVNLDPHAKIMFSSNDAEITLTFLDSDAGHSAMEAEWNQWANHYGFEPEQLGAIFQQGGDVFAIAGLKTGNRKYPVIGRRERDGKIFKFTARDVGRALAGAAAQPA